MAHDLNRMDDLGEWIMSDDSAVVNRLLSALCEAVWVTPEHEMTIEWQE